MPDILHRVGMQGSPAQVYEAIATTKGLSRWWITGTTGETSVGGVVKVRPEKGDSDFDMRVIESKPGEVVRWQCEAGAAEWIGTQLTFRLVGKGAEAYVLLMHAGWGEGLAAGQQEAVDRVEQTDADRLERLVRGALPDPGRKGGDERQLAAMPSEGRAVGDPPAGVDEVARDLVGEQVKEQSGRREAP